MNDIYKKTQKLMDEFLNSVSDQDFLDDYLNLRFNGKMNEEIELKAYQIGLIDGKSLFLKEHEDDRISEDRSPDYKEPIGQPEQTKQEPLSREQIMKCFADTYDSAHSITDFVRSIEKLHGITGGGE